MPKIIRKPKVLKKVSLSDATIWRLEQKGDFPGRISLGGNSVGWIEDEVDAWIKDRMNQRSQKVRRVKQ